MREKDARALADRLDSWAQNTEMIDQHFTAHGRDCTAAAAELRGDDNSVRVTFDTGNDAFSHGNGPQETARILRELADKIERGHEGGGLMDGNGNSIGRFTATFRPEGD